MNFPIRNKFPTSRAPREALVMQDLHPPMVFPGGTQGFLSSSGSLLPANYKIVSSKEPIKGLGDIVAMVANPIKEAIIRHGPEWAKTKLENCGCEKRRQWLNEKFPAIKEKE